MRRELVPPVGRVAEERRAAFGILITFYRTQGGGIFAQDDRVDPQLGERLQNLLATRCHQAIRKEVAVGHDDAQRQTLVAVHAVTAQVATQRKLCLYRNVQPLLMEMNNDRDTALAATESELKKRGIFQTGDVYAITGGEPMGAPGGTNMLKICRVS